MGLTIRWYLKMRGSETKARKLVGALHQAVGDLPFKEVSELYDLTGPACDFNNLPQDETDPLRWLLIQSAEEVQCDRVVTRHGIHHRSVRFSPERVLAFETLRGDGCESANIGRCRYPVQLVRRS
jgi:hypothetical protein